MVHPDDTSKHPAYINSSQFHTTITDTNKLRIKLEETKEQNDSLSQTEGVGVYYLAKFRGVHNHPLDFNLLNPENDVNIFKKKQVARTTVVFHENEMMKGNYL